MEKTWRFWSTNKSTHTHTHTTVCIRTPSKMAYDVLICQAVIASLDNLSSSSHICQFTRSHTSTERTNWAHHIHWSSFPLSLLFFDCQTLCLFYGCVKLLWIEPDGRQRIATDVWPQWLYDVNVCTWMCEGVYMWLCSCGCAVFCKTQMTVISILASKTSY